MGIRINRGYLAIGFAAVFLVGCASDKSDTDTMEDGPGDETQTMTDNTDSSDSMAQPEVVMPAEPEIRNGDIWVPETPNSQSLMALSGVFYSISTRRLLREQVIQNSTNMRVCWRVMGRCV